MSEKNIYKGFTDEASFEDYFEIEKYTDGLVRFINNCDTPMTISIQGTWGTGKTSVMNIVRNQLESTKRIRSIWFNTWQFSQFNMEDNLASSMLTCFIDELKPSEENLFEVKKMTMGLQVAGNIGKQMFLSLVDAKLGEKISERVENVMEAFSNTEETSLNPVHSINKFKEKFSLCVNETLEKTHTEKIVIFIDDLDRLEPRKAVEILEVLKLFLDCKKCVFVLAIDYDVVLQGVAAKYGHFSKDEKKDLQKGKDFFDKIIQVPFKMPVASYNITKYIAQCFSKIGMKDIGNEELSIYEKLIKNSIGTNPRTMKRMFNAFLLLTGIVSDEENNNNSTNKQILFGTLCLQHCDEEIYNYIVRNRNRLDGKSIILLEGDDVEIKELPDLNVSIERIQEIQPFINVLFDLIGRDKDGSLNNKKYRNFVNILELSSITGTIETPGKSSSTIIDNPENLNYDNRNINKINEVSNLLKSAGEKAEVIMYNQNSGTGVIAGIIDGNNKMRFVQSYGRKNGYRLELILKTKEAIDNADSYIKTLLSDVSNKDWSIKGNYILHTVTDNSEEELEKVKAMLKFAYETWIDEK